MIKINEQDGYMMLDAIIAFVILSLTLAVSINSISTSSKIEVTKRDVIKTLNAANLILAVQKKQSIHAINPNDIETFNGVIVDKKEEIIMLGNNQYQKTEIKISVDNRALEFRYFY